MRTESPSYVTLGKSSVIPLDYRVVRILGSGHALAEVDGFVTDDDPRLARFDGAPRRPVVLGAYAIPETGGAA